MDIVVKAFARPHYLDRCLVTMRRWVSGADRVVVLDDGTEVQLIDELRRRHPTIEVRASGRRPTAQRGARLDSQQSTEMGVPWQFWRAEIERLQSKCFLLLEEDQWFVGPVDLNAVKQVMLADDFAMIRSFEPKPAAFNAGRVQSARAGVCRLHPWFLKSRSHGWLMKKLHQCHPLARRILRRLRVPELRWRLGVYGVYQVAGAVFQSDYWSFVTDTPGDVVDEGRQTRRALGWALDNPRRQFGAYEGGVLRTTFRSSASNGTVDALVGFDMRRCNEILSTLWMVGELDPLEGLPQDFPISSIARALEDRGGSSCTPAAWTRWCVEFSEFYRQIGFRIE